jgi:hypothetical protein
MVTQEAFDKLPALIGRATFMAWSGYSDEDVSEGVKEGTVKTWKARSSSRKSKFYKWQLAGICGLKLK